MAASGGIPKLLPLDIVRCIADRTTTECCPWMRDACSAMSATVTAEPQPWILLQPKPRRRWHTVAEGERSRGFFVLSLPGNVKLSPTGSVI